MLSTEPPSGEGTKQEQQAEDSPLYKTDEFRMYCFKLCNDGIGCKRKVCFFAHTLDELRVSSVKLLPADIAAGADAAAFELDPFRARSETGRKAGGAAASMPGNEALVEALRTQQQQQKKAAAALQRSASRGLAAELQQLQAFQQLQAVLANTPGLAGLAPQLQQQGPMDSLLGAMMSQLRLGGAASAQPGLSQMAGGAGGIFDAVVQQAVQQALMNSAFNNAAQQAAAVLLMQQQQQQAAAAAAAAAAVAQQQQNQQAAAQAQALLEQFMLQHQQQNHTAHMAAGGPMQGSQPAAVQAALAALLQQQAAQQQAQQQHQQAAAPPMGPFSVPHGHGPAETMPVPIHSVRPSMEGYHASHVSPPPSAASPPLPPHMQPGTASSVRSSATGMLSTAIGSGVLEPGVTCPASEGAPSNAGPPSPRSLAASSTGSPPADAPLSSTLSHQAAVALSAAATAASYYSQEASRSSFESYRSSEMEMGLRHTGGPSSGGAARTSLDFIHASQQHQQQHGRFSRAGSLPTPCSPLPDEAMLFQEAHHRQLLYAAAAAQAAGCHGNNVPPGCGHGMGMGMGMSQDGQKMMADPVAMAGFGQHAALPFGM
ncbi:hypothetical protein GPECTOR_1g181 [Gonium pectorale]|uniref:C3H1-type domain-containing protein n=1 Tax=Gonium pectorale TaxID=33097 RepID=A0A150H240_GONPE|nr:hypothetical protein GPECTOR_1g181 [Gonium pectorale]|eukprot:KXZ56209.1 hypothetical protein GPECTOR_1g181 [Gonium pectorale]